MKSTAEKEEKKEKKKQTIENTLDDEQNRGDQAEDAKNGSGTTGRCADHCARWGESLCDTNEGENDTTKRKVTHSQRKKREKKSREKRRAHNSMFCLQRTQSTHSRGAARRKGESRRRIKNAVDGNGDVVVACRQRLARHPLVDAHGNKHICETRSTTTT